MLEKTFYQQILMDGQKVILILDKQNLISNQLLAIKNWRIAVYDCLIKITQTSIIMNNEISLSNKIFKSV